MKIKICGITNLMDALYCEAGGADALGFIFYQGSRRCVAPETAADISSRLSVYTATVGVFVNAPVTEVNLIMKQAKLHTAQIIAEDIAPYREHCDYPFYQCLRVNDDFDFSGVQLEGTRNILLDTYSKSAYGGTGEKFNWSIIPAWLRPAAIIAGGITEADLKIIKHSINPYGVDASSSLELEPGKKDHAKVEKFFKTVKEIR